MFNPSRFHRLSPLASLMFLVACGQSADQTPAEAPAVDEAAMTSPLPETTDAVEDARVFFVSLADGDVVSNPVVVEFGLEGMKLVPSGQDVQHSGHHHLIIDAGFPNMSLPIPSDDNYLHFGDASSSKTLTLEPGQHTLQLLVGDFLHIPHDPPVYSDRITITVE